ncbi:chemotaxis protein CheB [bacterium]|nr:chemotaxis protein CheB [bacterium]
MDTNKIERILVIGTSTGGPKALIELFETFPADLPFFTLIAQHIPPGFTRVLAELLDKSSKIRVRESSNMDRPGPASAYLAPGGYHLTVKSDLKGHYLKVADKPDNLPFKPSIDLLFESAVNIFGKGVTGVILTGLSTYSDGVNGCKAIKNAGGIVIVQSPEDCPAPGMPQNIINAGYADYVLPLCEMHNKIKQMI